MVNNDWCFFRQLRKEKILSMAAKINEELAVKKLELLQAELLAQEEVKEGLVAAHYRVQD